MKLNEVSVDGYGVCNNLRLQNIDDGLNVVFGRAATGKSTLIRYIRNVLFGFGTESGLGHGALEVTLNGSSYRLLRTAGTDGQLVATDLQGTRGQEPSNSVQHELSGVSADTYGNVFVVSTNQDLNHLVSIATTRCNVPLGRQAAFGNASEFSQNENQKREFQLRLVSIDSRIADLENQRQELNHRIDQLEFSLPGNIGDVNSELASISQQLQCINIAGIKSEIHSLDHEIMDLQNEVDAGQKAVVSREFVEPTVLSDLYQRLDELDDQIRRWRQVHADIQQQRVQLKNEMVVWSETPIESAKHPYHRAQEIVTAIESKVGLAEQSVDALQDVQIVTAENNAVTAEKLNELCGGIRRDLYQLCDELGDQFKQIRHRAATAELKRLRRCYEEIGDNIRVIVDRRDAVIAEIRKLDPEGARLIDRNDQDFCRCAMHDGYLQARNRYAGPILPASTTPASRSFDHEIRRIQELRNFRSTRVSELVDCENRISGLESRRRELLSQKDQAAERRQLDEFKAQFHRLRVEVDELKKQREALVVELDSLNRFDVLSPNAVLESAAVYVAALTRNDIGAIWFADANLDCGLVVLDRNNTAQNYESLSLQHRSAVRLSIGMAIAEYFAKQGSQLPVLVDNAFDSCDEQQVRNTLDAMQQFCRQGNQLIAFTSNHAAAELARRNQVTTLDLPETSVSPAGPGAPSWQPERIEDYPPREPEFLTPYTTRMHQNVVTNMTTYPLVKYPPVGSRFEHKAVNFDGPTPLEQTDSDDAYAPRTVAVNENLSLSALSIFDSMDVERLNRLGVDTISQLLEIDPADLPSDFIESHISSSQMDKWQALCWLIICVPGMDAADARILYAIGITEPEQLETTNSSHLIERINRFLRSADGQAFATLSKLYNQDIANRWYDALSSTRSSWRMPSGYSRRSRYSTRPSRLSRSYDRERNHDRDRVRRQSNRSIIRVERDRDRNSGRRGRRDWRPEREARIYDASSRRSGSEPTSSDEPVIKSKSPAANESGLKFYLQTADDLEAAPSIGPKTSERFQKIKVNTISDFLTQTAESMASKINYKRITADVIRQWQHQARLVCRVPNLRGHDAQLLVACGITEPEDLAQRQAQSLFKTIEPFAKSKEGLKIIRGGKQPDLAEVTDWINWARQTRSLQAA